MAENTTNVQKVDAQFLDGPQEKPMDQPSRVEELTGKVTLKILGVKFQFEGRRVKVELE